MHSRAKRNELVISNPSRSESAIGGFTVLRFTGMLGMRNVTFTKEELLKMNAKLNKIKRSK